jgi:hypothetical protein
LALFLLDIWVSDINTNYLYFFCLSNLNLDTIKEDMIRAIRNGAMYERNSSFLKLFLKNEESASTRAIHISSEKNVIDFGDYSERMANKAAPHNDAEARDLNEDRGYSLEDSPAAAPGSVPAIKVDQFQSS